jgi:hypothetical protein
LKLETPHVLFLAAWKSGAPRYVCERVSGRSAYWLRKHRTEAFKLAFDKASTERRKALWLTKMYPRRAL